MDLNSNRDSFSSEIVDHDDDFRHVISPSPIKTSQDLKNRSGSYISQSSRPKRSTSQKLRDIRIPRSQIKPSKSMVSILSTIHEDPLIAHLEFSPLNSHVKNANVTSQTVKFSPQAAISPLKVLKSPLMLSTPNSRISLEEAIYKSAKRVKLLKSGQRVRDLSWTEVKLKSEAKKLGNIEDKENVKSIKYSQNELELLYSQSSYSAYKQKEESLKRKYTDSLQDSCAKRIKYV